MNEDTKSQTKSGRIGLHAARVAAVQALYQIAQVDLTPTQVMNEFLEHRLNVAPEQEHDVLVNKDHFKAVLTSFESHQERINQLIASSLIEGWTIKRLEPVLLAILQAGCAEFLLDKDIPAPVVISEYVTVTKEFYAGKEPGFVNGMLDHIARELELSMRNGESKPPAEVEDYLQEAEISGVPNWEGEGGAP